MAADDGHCPFDSTSSLTGTARQVDGQRPGSRTATRVAHVAHWQAHAHSKFRTTVTATGCQEVPVSGSESYGPRGRNLKVDHRADTDMTVTVQFEVASPSPSGPNPSTFPIQNKIRISTQAGPPGIVQTRTARIAVNPGRRHESYSLSA